MDGEVVVANRRDEVGRVVIGYGGVLVITGMKVLTMIIVSTHSLSNIVLISSDPLPNLLYLIYSPCHSIYIPLNIRLLPNKTIPQPHQTPPTIRINVPISVIVKLTLVVRRV